MKALRWAGFVLLLWFAMLPQLSKAGEMDHCYFDAEAALSIAKDIEYGFPLDSHRACNPKFCTDDEKIAEFGEWWDRLKAAVKQEWDNLPDAPDRAALAAQRVLEACAYDHGKNRQKYLHKTQGERFVRPDMNKEFACQQQLPYWREFYIGVKRAGSYEAALTEFNFTPDSKPEHIKRHIDAVLNSQNPSSWMWEQWNACIGGES